MPFRQHPHHHPSSKAQRDHHSPRHHDHHQPPKTQRVDHPSKESPSRMDLYSSQFITFPFTLFYWTTIVEDILHDPIQTPSQLNQVLKKIQTTVCQAVGQSPAAEIQSQTNLDLLVEEKIFAESWQGRVKFFEQTLPFMVDLVKKSPMILGPHSLNLYYNRHCPTHSTIISNEGQLPLMGNLNRIPLLARPSSKVMTFTKLECACILANAFFLTWPRLSDTREAHIQMPSINFDTLYMDPRPSTIAKLLMIIHYFERISERMFQEIASHGVMTVIRKRVDTDQVKEKLCDSLSVTTWPNISIDNEGSIEQCENALHADFANCYIGGGVLLGGAVQEEIRFCLSPETIVTRLFVEKLDQNEVLYILGTEQFSEHAGYGSSLQFKDDYVDKNFIVDEFGHRNFTSQIMAFDSLYYSHHDKLDQWQSEHIDREIVKAYAAFSKTPNRLNIDMHNKIATGNWGCGAFYCDKQLKFLIQYIAAALAKCSLHYYTFGDKDNLADKLHEFIRIVTTHNFSVFRVYQALISMIRLDIIPNLQNKTENYYPSTLKFVLETLLKEESQQMDVSNSQIME
nr:unnamed protein product [Naegleria fowleri]